MTLVALERTGGTNTDECRDEIRERMVPREGEGGAQEEGREDREQSLHLVFAFVQS